VLLEIVHVNVHAHVLDPFSICLRVFFLVRVLDLVCVRDLVLVLDLVSVCVCVFALLCSCLFPENPLVSAMCMAPHLLISAARICGIFWYLQRILKFQAELSAKGFQQNPRWWPFKIKKDVQHAIFQWYLSVEPISTPVSFCWRQYLLGAHFSYSSSFPRNN
jgi:hypothetical protein